MKKKLLVLGIIVFLFPLFVKVSQVFADTPQTKPTPEDILGLDPGESNDKKYWLSIVNDRRGKHPLFDLQDITFGENTGVTSEEDARFILIQSDIDPSVANIKLLVGLADNLKKHWVNFSNEGYRNYNGRPIYKDAKENLRKLTEEFFNKFDRKQRVKIYCALEWIFMAGNAARIENLKIGEVVRPSNIKSRYSENLCQRFPKNCKQVIQDFADTVTFVRSRVDPGLPTREELIFRTEKKREREAFLSNLRTFEHFK